MKNSFSLLEIILTLLISSIVIIYSTLYSKKLFLENKQNRQIEIDKIDFLSTKVFIEKHKYELEKITFSNNNLYFNNHLLLEDVKNFTINQSNKEIKIFINLKDKIIQNWEFNL